MTKRVRPSAKMPTDRLVGKGRQGDAIHQTQEMGAARGFKNVSGKWLDQCLTYEQVNKAISEGKAEIEDFLVPFGEMTPRLDDDNNFLMEIQGRGYRPTEYCLKHLAAKTGVSLFDVEVLSGIRPDSNGKTRNRREDREALMKLLGAGFSLISPKKKFLFRTQKDGTMRAWLSDTYRIMDNHWFLQIISQIIPDGLWSHWRGDGDKSTLWGNVLIPDSIRVEKDSDYGGMFSVGNSEIGRRRLYATPSLFRAICMNGCIWDQTKGETFRRIHRGEIDLAQLTIQLRNHLTKQIPIAATFIDVLLGTREIGWDGASVKPVFAALGKEFRLSKAENTSVLNAWRKQSEEEEIFQDDKMRRSAFGVINAVTRAGQEETDPSKWVRREEMGGQLLGWKRDEWSSLFNSAKKMSAEEVVESFAMTSE